MASDPSKDTNEQKEEDSKGHLVIQGIIFTLSFLFIGWLVSLISFGDTFSNLPWKWILISTGMLVSAGIAWKLFKSKLGDTKNKTPKQSSGSGGKESLSLAGVPWKMILILGLAFFGGRYLFHKIPDVWRHWGEQTMVLNGKNPKRTIEVERGYHLDWWVTDPSQLRVNIAHEERGNKWPEFSRAPGVDSLVIVTKMVHTPVHSDYE